MTPNFDSTVQKMKFQKERDIKHCFLRPGVLTLITVTTADDSKNNEIR
jgi:hypothetical protein